ncbi:hypothetical protein Tco_0112436, partial [Tanacetum coccineum]
DTPCALLNVVFLFVLSRVIQDLAILKRPKNSLIPSKPDRVHIQTISSAIRGTYEGRYAMKIFEQNWSISVMATIKKARWNQGLNELGKSLYLFARDHRGFVDNVKG